MISDIPRLFLLFEVFVKSVGSLISFSYSLPFVYRKANDFCELMLYSAILLKVFISCRSFLVNFFGSFVFTIISLNKYTLIFFFPICIPLISFSCLTVLTETSSTVLNRYGENGQPCHVPGFMETTFSVTLKDIWVLSSCWLL